MELYFFMIIILFILAASDLMVGVSNDAVNFTNSAIGSRAASRWAIMIFASIGIFCGTFFSSGMMEIARKSVFFPEKFLFPEIMIIFLAVMFTDILLLDFYNTFGMPTSTTVSLMFEILGASMAMTLIKIFANGETLNAVGNYLNVYKALGKISGIFIAIGIAFFFGMVIQFITRLIFTFDYQKQLRRFGSIWCALAMSALTYFILIKGLKGSSFFTKETYLWIKANTLNLNLISFLVWLLVFQLLVSFTRMNILKCIVLFGTASLALAFSANDLINFIGVPLAGFAAYQTAVTVETPLALNMSSLNAPAQIPLLILFIVSVIMIVTLWRSKKARSVLKTEVDLARQGEGPERFKGSFLAKMIIHMGCFIFKFLKLLTPLSLQSWIHRRLDSSQFKARQSGTANAPSFDLLRAAVNLTVASSLIAYGTSLKLPLSTTYVTFMVAMGSSLADKAWGRESAVFRVTGVLTVVGSWFLTAILAFSGAFLLAIILYYGKLFSIIALTVVATFFVYQTHALHRKREKEHASQIPVPKPTLVSEQ